MTFSSVPTGICSVLRAPVTHVRVDSQGQLVELASRGTSKAGSRPDQRSSDARTALLRSSGEGDLPAGCWFLLVAGVVGQGVTSGAEESAG